MKTQVVWLPDGFGGGGHAEVCRASDYAALEAENERLAEEIDRMSVITGDYIARCQGLADELASILLAEFGERVEENREAA